MRQIDSKQETARGKLSDKALDCESTMIKKKKIWRGMEGDGMRRYTEKREEIFKCWSRARAWSTPVGPSCWNSEAGNSRCCLYCCSSAPCG